MADITKLEADLWEAADELRANSKLSSRGYCMPVLGLVFLRYAWGRFKRVDEQADAERANIEGRKPPKDSADYTAKGAMYLPEEARYDYLVDLPADKDIDKAANGAMAAIAKCNPNLQGVLPNTYTELGNDILREVLRIFNNKALDEDGDDIIGRMTLGVPKENKEGEVSTSGANYLWINYFYSCLNKKGCAGFVIASSATDPKGEKQQRRKLVESGDDDAMLYVGNNFFYTKSLPCTLWFFGKGRPYELRDKAFFIDAQRYHPAVSTTLNEWTPWQLKNLTAIVWLYRGEVDSYEAPLDEYYAFVKSQAKNFGDPGSKHQEPGALFGLKHTIDSSDILPVVQNGMTDVIEARKAPNKAFDDNLPEREQKRKREDSGVKIKHLKPDHLRGVEIVVADEAIVKSFSEITRLLLSKQDLCRRAISRPREARDRLLPKLMSGEMEVGA